MNVHLDQRAIPEGFEAVNLAGLDDENVPGAAFKRLSIHGPYSAAFPDKLDLIVGMPMRPGPLARQAAKQNTETPTSRCSVPTNSWELPTNGNSS